MEAASHALVLIFFNDPWALQSDSTDGAEPLMAY